MKATSINPLVGRAVPCAPKRSVARRGGAHGVTRPTNLSLALALCAAFTLLTHTSLAQTWQTVDDFQYTSGAFAQNYGLCVAPSGTVFAAGVANHPTKLGHALVMASSDAGDSWSTPLDDFVYQDTTRASYVGGIVADASGNLYTAGCSGIEFLTSRWLVRRSTDNGLTWQTVDDFSLGGLHNTAWGIAADASGNIYVVGVASTNRTSYGATWVVRNGVNGTSWSTVDMFALDSGSAAYGVVVHPTAGVFVVGNSIVASGKSSFSAWTVRRSLNDGVTWNTVDTFQLGNTSQARGIGMDAQGNLYAVGNAFETVKGKTRSHWIVRRSSNGAVGSWTTVDDFQPSSDGRGVASAFAADAQGNLFVAGLGAGSNGGSSQWLVRKSPGGVGAWSTVDNFQYVAGAETQAHAIAADHAGNVFVGGHGNDANGESHWLIRRFQ